MPVKSTHRVDYETSAMPLGVMPKDYPDGCAVETHRHERGQLIYASAGLMKISADGALWLLPPQHALWMPAGRDHDMQAIGPVSLRSLYVRPDALPPGFPDQPKVIRVSPFLRELLLRAAALPIGYAGDSHDAHILGVLLGEIALACAAIDFRLAAARDRRLARVCDALIADPARDDSLEDWAAFAGTSGRTLARLFNKEFGVSFVAWRQQVRIMLALPRLATGTPVTTVATDLGYATPGAFTQVFRRLMGAAPSSYFEA